MRYLADTVTLSEMRRGAKAHPGILRWQNDLGEIFLSVITLNEIRFGLKKVKRNDPAFAEILATWYARLIEQPDRFRILPVDRPIAELAADFRFAHSTSIHDSLIAATAKIHDLTLVTRNVGDFTPTGVPVLNPWENPEN